MSESVDFKALGDSFRAFEAAEGGDFGPARDLLLSRAYIHDGMLEYLSNALPGGPKKRRGRKKSRETEKRHIAYLYSIALLRAQGWKRDAAVDPRPLPAGHGDRTDLLRLATAVARPRGLLAATDRLRSMESNRSE